MSAVQKDPILIIADLENQNLYSALPLWDEQVEFYTPNAASRRSQRFRADLIIVDCGFDDEIGVEMLRNLALKNPGIPVTFITGAGSEQAAVEVFRLGAQDYIKKPIDLLAFGNRIRQFLERKRGCHLDRWRLEDATDPPLPRAGITKAVDLPPHLLRCIRYIKENLAEPLTLEAMAQEGSLSKYYFCREFKKNIGMTPMQFLARIRVKRSKDLLRKSLPISTIAMKVGFNDLSAFNRQFRKLVGQTPTDFRKSLLDS